MSSVQHHQSADNGNVVISDSATRHLNAYLEKTPGCLGVRFSVKKTGCSGYSYVVDYVSTPQADDMKQPFTKDYAIYIDKKSYPYLKGIHVDFVKQGLNGKLVFDNPNQTGECGCGESFTVEK